MNSNYQWFNRNLPQTLVNAQMLCYFSGVRNLLNGSVSSPIGFLFTAGLIGGAFGIANEKTWGYFIALITAAISVLYPISVLGIDVFRFGPVINIMFDVALVVLLVHPQSRSHQKVWFR